MIESVFAFAVLAQFLAPGFLFQRFRRTFFVIETERNPQESLLTYLVTGMVINAATWPLFSAFGFDPLGSLVAAQNGAAFLQEIAGHPLRWFLQLVIAPVMLAIFVAYVERQAWGTEVFTAIGLPPLPNRPNAISAAVFHHRDADAILEVHLKDGTKLHGRLGMNAAVTASAGYPDLFLDAVYMLDTRGGFLEDEECSGLIVMGSEISRIHFLINPEIAAAVAGEEEEDDELDTLQDASPAKVSSSPWNRPARSSDATTP